MGNLLKAEFFKLMKSFSYKVLLAVSFIIGIIFCITLVRNGSASTGNAAISIMGTGYLYNAAFISIFAAEYIGSEFANRTFAGEISCGASRWELSGAKTIVYFIGILPLILLYDLIPACMLTVRNGFGMVWSMDAVVFVIRRLLFCILCNLAMGSYILLLTYLVKSRVAIVGLGIGSLYVLHQICINESNPALLKIWRFTFIYQIEADVSGRPMHLPAAFGVVVISSLVAVAGMSFLAALLFQKSDLK